MIVALLTDPFLKATVRAAALPDEDVYSDPGEVLEALSAGFPRLAVYANPDTYPLGDPRDLVPRRVPLLVISEPTLRSWDTAHRAVGFAVRRVDDHAKRLRGLMNHTSGATGWVETLFRDLVRASGASLPWALKGFGRRVLEYPRRYEDLGSVARLTGLSRGAVKERFRRRDLPSPYTYLRWFRVFASGHLLSRDEVTTEEVAHHVGLHSSGNFCRYVQDVSGLAPREIRGPVGRTRLVTRFAASCLRRDQLEGWNGLEDLFLEGVA